MRNKDCNCAGCPTGQRCSDYSIKDLAKPSGTAPQTIRVGLAGNPNSGKTTLFNVITGAHQKVGNYAGVTIEKKQGHKIFEGIDIVFYDLPGIYSLTAYSLDEVIARDFIIDEKPDIIVDVIDSTNIERNLFLCLQFQELGVPVIGALNMIDEAESLGISIDEKELSCILGLPLVKTCGKKNMGIESLLRSIVNEASVKKEFVRTISYGSEVEKEIDTLLVGLSTDPAFVARYSARWIAIKLLEKDSSVHSKLDEHQKKNYIVQIASRCVQNIEKHFGRDAEIVMSEQRYAYVHGAVSETVIRRTAKQYQLTKAVDNILLNRLLGLPLFLFVMWGIFQLTFALGKYPMSWLESLFSFMSNVITSAVPNGAVQSLLVDGIIGGVGGVLSFVPLVIVLFVCISILEDSGYMARAAFLMDKFLHIFGLHGQSFVPMIIGFGCSVPAVMSARTLKNDRDRIITILIMPFMSCGAKLPVYILLAGAFFPRNAGNVVMAVYIIGVVLALLSALLFRKTVLAGEATPFVMELPPYRMPTARGILWHVWDKTSRYLRKAGTILLAASILIWVAVSFPKPTVNNAKYESLFQEYRSAHITTIKAQISGWVSGSIPLATIADEQEREDAKAIVKDISSGKATIESKAKEKANDEATTYIKTVKAHDGLVHSIAGRVGKIIEPVVRPLGFDWKIGISVITGMAAKEAVVSTLGVLYNTGTDADEKSMSLRAALQSDPSFTRLVAFVLMIMTLIAPPCIAALSTIRAEVGWGWFGFQIGYSLTLAWTICFVIYQIGSRVVH